jgi:2-methylcitrate dehydratase PrpD
VELIGSTLDWNKIVYRYVVEMGGRAESTIVNYGTRAPALDVAFVNATFGQGCELDDVGFGAGGHLSAATVPVALALSEKERVSDVNARFDSATAATCRSSSLVIYMGSFFDY